MPTPPPLQTGTEPLILRSKRANASFIVLKSYITTFKTITN